MNTPASPHRPTAMGPSTVPWERSDESGLTLAAVVILTLVLVSLTGGLMSLGLSRHQESEIEVSRLRALNAAEAGLGRAVDEIWRQYRTASEDDRIALVDRLDGKFSREDLLLHHTVAFSDAEYDVEVIEVVREGDDHADARIRATGRSGSVQRTITAVMRYGRKKSRVFNYAYFINNYGWLWGAGITVNGDVCSNGDFSAKNPYVHGDIYACRNPELGALGTIDGASRHEGLDWYHAHAPAQARPTNPTADLDGPDDNDNGIPDEWEYDTGYDGGSDRFEGQDPIEMPFLGQLELYKELAARKHGSIRGAGGVVVDEVHAGNLVLVGTAADPIVVDGPVVVTGDVIVKGVIRGKGTIYAGRNVHVADNLSYATPATWPKPSADPHGDAARNSGADLVGLAARGSVIIGDYTVNSWVSVTRPYLRPPFTQSYVVPATDADIGYVNTTLHGLPAFNGDYLAQDGGNKADGTERRYYESSLTDAAFHALCTNDVQRIDAVLYTNHAVSGKVGRGMFNGTIVSRDEAIIYNGSIDINYDVRIHDDGYETIDIYLPRAPMRELLMWREEDGTSTVPAATAPTQQQAPQGQ